MKDFFALCNKSGPAWIRGNGNQEDVVLLTRASVVRNLRSFPFPNKASDVELGTILGEVTRKVGDLPQLASGWDLRLDLLSRTQCLGLQEMWLIRQGMLRNPAHRGVFIDKDLGSNILVNHEDHLTLQAFQSGLEPGKALNSVLESQTTSSF